jgi:hypothetical protein
VVQERPSLPHHDRNFDAVRLIQLRLQPGRVGQRRKLHSRHLGRRADARGRQGWQFHFHVQAFESLMEQHLTAIGRASPGMLFKKGNRRRDRQEARGIARAHPLQAVEKARAAFKRIVASPAPADRQRHDHRLNLSPGKQKLGPLGSHHPLVAVADIDVGRKG